MLEKLTAAHAAGKLQFFGGDAHLARPDAFTAVLAPLRKTKWFVYSKRPFAGPEAVLAYLSRYTHRVAISNSRLIALDNDLDIQGQRLSDRGGRPIQDHDTRRCRVHPPLPDPRPAQRIPPHSPLRALRQWLPCPEPRARSRATRRSSSIAPTPTRQFRAMPQKPTTCAPMPVLWRPDDHHRDLRARMPTALSTIRIEHRCQDRHLMTIIAAFPRCRTKLACRWSATGRNKAQPFHQHCRPGTPLTAAFGLRLDRQPDPLPLAKHPANRPDGSRALHAVPSQRPNPHNASAKLARSSPAGSSWRLPDAGPSLRVVRSPPASGTLHLI